MKKQFESDITHIAEWFSDYVDGYWVEVYPDEIDEIKARIFGNEIQFLNEVTERITRDEGWTMSDVRLIHEIFTPNTAYDFIMKLEPIGLADDEVK